MSQERDTHFAGWAKLQIQKLQQEGLLEAWNPDFGEIDLEKVQRATQLLSQGAYDLAFHVTGHVAATTMDSTLVLRHVPDLTECPVEVN